MRKIGKFLGTGLMWVTGAFLAMFGFAASLAVVHTAFPTPDNTANFGLFAAVENMNNVITTNMLSKVIVPNNAATAYQIPNNTAYVLFTGVQSSVAATISMPSAANALDGQEVTIFSASTAAATTTIASTGATVVGAPASLVANETLKFKYDSGTTSWYLIAH